MNPSQITTKEIKLAEIVIDAGTQIRTAISDATVSEYAERMADGDIFPHPHVYFDGSRYILADGFHRVLACQRNGVEVTCCEVHKGTADDARRFALSANGSNGLRMTNADKHKAVSWALELYPTKSSRELAKICFVSHQFVENCRNQLSTVDSCERVGADGKQRKLPAKAEREAAQDLSPLPTHHSTPPKTEAEETADMAREVIAGAKPEVREQILAAKNLSKTELSLIDAAELAVDNLNFIIGEIKAGNAIDCAELKEIIAQNALTSRWLHAYSAEIC